VGCTRGFLGDGVLSVVRCMRARRGRREPADRFGGCSTSEKGESGGTPNPQENLITRPRKASRAGRPTPRESEKGQSGGTPNGTCIGTDTWGEHSPISSFRCGGATQERRRLHSHAEHGNELLTRAVGIVESKCHWAGRLNPRTPGYTAKEGESGGTPNPQKIRERRVGRDAQPPENMITPALWNVFYVSHFPKCRPSGFENHETREILRFLNLCIALCPTSETFDDSQT
jgi:hypothetical protein